MSVGNASVAEDEDAGSANIGDEGNASLGEDVGNASIGEDVGNASIGEDVGTASMGEDVGNASMGEDVGNASSGEDVGNACMENVGSAKLLHHISAPSISSLLGTTMGATSM